VFEPTHGSAPKYAGQYKVNPIAMLLTTKLMLDWLKETEMATRWECHRSRHRGRQSPHV
jgi:3-isopropylmalate dehydrogenase